MVCNALALCTNPRVNKDTILSTEFIGMIELYSRPPAAARCIGGAPDLYDIIITWTGTNLVICKRVSSTIGVIRGQNLLKEGLSADDADGRRWNPYGITKRDIVGWVPTLCHRIELTPPPQSSYVIFKHAGAVLSPGYVAITSGTGSATPSCLVTLTMKPGWITW